jgi:hypothetical protein
VRRFNRSSPTVTRKLSKLSLCVFVRRFTPIYNTLVIHNSGVEITTNEALVQEPFF